MACVLALFCLERSIRFFRSRSSFSRFDWCVWSLRSHCALLYAGGHGWHLASAALLAPLTLECFPMGHASVHAG